MANCHRATTGGKGNFGNFYERDPKVFAAGVPTAQPDESVPDHMQYYLLQNKVDALINDAIIPPPKRRPLPPLRHPIKLDSRFCGPFSQMAALINPPSLTKFQTLVEDIKQTVYSSYWKKPLGKSRDPIPMMPAGYDINGTTYGKKVAWSERAYDVIMPKHPLKGQTPPSKECALQVDRTYQRPAFDPDYTYGMRSHTDPHGVQVKACLQVPRIISGNGSFVINHSGQADFAEEHQSRLGKALCPNDNIKYVKEGHAFGKVKPSDKLYECLVTCELNEAREDFKRSLSHLNSLRKVMSKKFLPTFFKTFYLELKYFDENKTGWLDKTIIYNYCASKLIRFDPVLLEPLLSMWQIFDGNNIEYKTFVRILNFKDSLPDLPRVFDMDPKCIDFTTTYQDMIKPNKEEDDRRVAGVDSGQFFDKDYPVTPAGYCKAARACLPQESDMRSCLNPSVMTLFYVDHRDMYAVREPNVVRKVFEGAGETFTDEEFEEIWKEAQIYHPNKFVCFETFRRAMNKKRGKKH